MSLAEVKRWLEESVPLGVKEYYFTGGEPFLNPDLVPMLVETLDYGPATVLTNGTVFKDVWLDELSAAESQSRYSLEFRVSLDGFTADSNDPIRGEGTFDRTLSGVLQLVEYGFLPIITAARTWPNDQDEAIVAGFERMLRAQGYLRPRLKVLPTLRIGAEETRTSGYQVQERVTREMMVDYDASQLVCEHSRIVSDRGVHVCPILIETPDSLLGATLVEAQQDYAIQHGACFTCYQYGAICANPSGGNAGRRSVDQQGTG